MGAPTEGSHRRGSHRRGAPLGRRAHIKWELLQEEVLTGEGAPTVKRGSSHAAAELLQHPRGRAQGRRIISTSPSSHPLICLNLPLDKPHRKPQGKGAEGAALTLPRVKAGQDAFGRLEHGRE